jgi:hypothetical protein
MTSKTEISRFARNDNEDEPMEFVDNLKTIIGYVGNTTQTRFIHAEFSIDPRNGEALFSALVVRN